MNDMNAPTISDPSQEFYWQILESLRDGILFADKDKTVTYWNRRAEELTGYRRGEILGRECCDKVLVHVGDGGKSLCGSEGCALARAIDKGEYFECKATLTHKEGRKRSIHVRVNPIQNESGERVGAVQIFWPA